MAISELRELYQRNCLTTDNSNSLSRAILSRSDIDVSLKDIEGYTAFDLYNSTIRTAKPSPLSDKALELYTWGTNRYVPQYVQVHSEYRG